MTHLQAGIQIVDLSIIALIMLVTFVSKFHK